MLDLNAIVLGNLGGFTVKLSYIRLDIVIRGLLVLTLFYLYLVLFLEYSDLRNICMLL